MCWAGHVARMRDERLPKQLFYDELTRGKRPQYKPRKRFKDVLKSNLIGLEIDMKTVRPGENSSGKDVAISNENGWSTLH